MYSMICVFIFPNWVYIIITFCLFNCVFCLWLGSSKTLIIHKNTTKKKIKRDSKNKVLNSLICSTTTIDATKTYLIVAFLVAFWYSLHDSFIPVTLHTISILELRLN